MLHTPDMNHHGFTLLEIIVAMLLGIIISTAAYAFYVGQYRVKLQQEQVAIMQQNIRAAMAILSKDIRRAGYDPLGVTSAGFTEAKSNEFTFSYTIDGSANGLDDDGDGTKDEADEANLIANVSYALESTAKKLVRKHNGGQEVTAAENVEAIEFRYRLTNNTLTSTPSNLDEIDAVEIALLARTGKPQKDLTNRSTYQVFSKTYGPFNDGYKRRLLITTIQCRNQGLSL